VLFVPYGVRTFKQRFCIFDLWRSFSTGGGQVAKRPALNQGFMDSSPTRVMTMNLHLIAQSSTRPARPSLLSYIFFLKDVNNRFLPRNFHVNSSKNREKICTITKWKELFRIKVKNENTKDQNYSMLCICISYTAFYVTQRDISIYL
jgi:hypothetical protein